MVVIVGTKFDAAQVAPIVRQVHCEKCGCDYSYEMIRRGTGVASTAYGLFAKSRQKAAVAEAAQNLRGQLDHDHDPVACPDCRWIQSTMVADLRRRAYGWMTKPGWSIGLFLLLFDGFWIAVGISAKLQGSAVRPFATVVAVVAAVVAVAIISATVGLQYALRSRIDPNRDYPDEPGYVPGAPKAVKLCDASRETPSAVLDRGPKLPYERKRRELERGSWITVQLERFRCPPLCCKCLSAADQTYTLRITKLARTSVPFCGNCRRRARRQRTIFYSIMLLAVASIGFVLPVLCGSAFDVNISTLLAIIFALVVLVAVALLSFPLPGPVKCSRFRHDLNTVRLRFRNPAYAPLLIEQGQLT